MPVSLSRRAVLTAIAIYPWAATSARGQAMVDHQIWDDFLRRSVRSGSDGVNRLDFAAVKAQDHTRLKRYLDQLAEVHVATLDRAEAIAFWINLYNAATLDIVLERYPVRSIRDIALPRADGNSADGPWSAPVVRQRARRLSLDDIEKQELAALTRDPRIHYALNCLSVGCPNLPAEAFTAQALDAQLDAAARAFVNDPRGLSLIGGRVIASSIYEWYQADFGGSLSAVLDHMRRYATAERRAEIDRVRAIDAYEYDWALVDITR